MDQIILHIPNVTILFRLSKHLAFVKWSNTYQQEKLTERIQEEKLHYLSSPFIMGVTKHYFIAVNFMTDRVAFKKRKEAPANANIEIFRFLSQMKIDYYVDSFTLFMDYKRPQKFGVLR
ncbi:hypothetical protein [Sporosarcina sp. USHLN248]|uniref:hypothetical protein n=1 Tax=Sporosarcina sp. USHLN248 TaxID=3081300 RepID=UPI00301AA049